MLPPTDQRLKFHRDFGFITEALAHSHRFLTSINYSSLIYRTGAVCTWIPKNGCSNLRYSLAIENGVLTSSHGINWIHLNSRIFRPELRDCYNAKYSFVFLRCPIERIVSVFLDKFIDSPETARFREMFKKFYPDNNVRERLNFYDFIKWIVGETVKNVHWQNQADFLLFEQYNDYFDLRNFAGAQKKLKQEIDFQLLDMRESLAHDLSPFTRRYISRAYEMPIASLSELKKTGLVPAPESFISDEISELIQIYWMKDFILYRNHFGVPDLWSDIGVRV